MAALNKEQIKLQKHKLFRSSECSSFIIIIDIFEYYVCMQVLHKLLFFNSIYSYDYIFYTFSFLKIFGDKLFIVLWDICCPCTVCLYNELLIQCLLSSMGISSGL